MRFTAVYTTLFLIACAADSPTGVFDDQALARYSPEDRAYVMGHAMGVYQYGRTLPGYVAGTGYRYAPGASSADARVSYDYAAIVLAGSCDCTGGDCVGDCSEPEGGGDSSGCTGADDVCPGGGDEPPADPDGDPPPIDEDCETFLDPAAMDARLRAGKLDVASLIGDLDPRRFQQGLADALALEDLGDNTDYSEPEHLKEHVRDYGLCEHSPLVLDLAGDGIAASAPEVRFDLKGTGKQFLVAWPNHDDALLAYDRDGDGRITSGAELFGNIDAANGFESLARLDDNGDGVVDARDPGFSRLVLWRDANRDGASDGELVSLAAEGIVTLPVAYTTSNARDPFGNALAQQGEFHRAGSGSGLMIDVWFRLRR